MTFNRNVRPTGKGSLLIKVGLPLLLVAMCAAWPFFADWRKEDRSDRCRAEYVAACPAHVREARLQFMSALQAADRYLEVYDRIVETARREASVLDVFPSQPGAIDPRRTLFLFNDEDRAAETREEGLVSIDAAVAVLRFSNEWAARSLSESGGRFSSWDLYFNEVLKQWPEPDWTPPFADPRQMFKMQAARDSLTGTFSLNVRGQVTYRVHLMVDVRDALASGNPYWRRPYSFTKRKNELDMVDHVLVARISHSNYRSIQYVGGSEQNYGDPTMVISMVDIPGKRTVWRDTMTLSFVPPARIKVGSKVMSIADEQIWKMFGEKFEPFLKK